MDIEVTGYGSVKSSAYADDLTCFLADITSCKNTIAKLEAFSTVSGLRMNTSKSEALWLGKNRFRKDKPLNVKWSNAPIKILGIYISYDTALAMEMNFAAPLANLRASLNFWKMRGLTLFGKIQIIRSLGISRVLYVLNLTETSRKFLLY